MNRKRVFWVESPDDDDDFDRDWLRCRLAGGWFAVDGDRAIVPITAVERRSEGTYDGSPGLLVQYGGADLILDMVDIEEGDTFTVVNPRNGRPYVEEQLDRDDEDDD